MINIKQITANFSKIAISQIGHQSGFIKRETKLNALYFIVSFFESFSAGTGCEVKTWVQNLSKLLGVPLSKQGFNKRLGWRCVGFCEQILASCVSHSLQKAVVWRSEGSWVKSFNRVFLEDSTCLRLPQLLYGIYGGSANQKANYAIARIQVRLELSTERLHNIAIKSYGETDVCFSADILSVLGCGDLVIRDLGYSVIAVFEKIQLLGAFFISRWHPHTRLCCFETQKALDLGNMLAKAAQNGKEVIDTKVFLGLKNQFPVRLIAIKVPPDAEKKRRQNTEKQQKTRNIKYSQAYF